MIIKQCQFSGRDDKGTYVHLIYPGEYNDHLIKEAQAGPPQLERAREVIYSAPKKNGHIYTFVSAMGAGEYWGSNSNGDDFPEEPLIHTPPGWSEMSHSRQRTVGKTWEWGYPTFYNAHAFQHHVNKDPARAFGTVYYAMWDSHMKRVLLILELSGPAAKRMGAQGILDRIENGEFPDVSMGCKVPFDVCSTCADWERITPLLGKPKLLLAEHKKKPIRGISVTRNDYCQHLRFEINKIYPDGKKVRMMNYHPKFFDISHVFIGADKTSKVMAKLAGEQLCPIRNNTPMCKKGCYTCGIPSSHVYEVWSRDMKKSASSASAIAKHVGKRTGIGSGVGAVGGGIHGGVTSDSSGLEYGSDIASGALRGAALGAAAGTAAGAYKPIRRTIALNTSGIQGLRGASQKEAIKGETARFTGDSLMAKSRSLGDKDTDSRLELSNLAVKQLEEAINREEMSRVLGRAADKKVMDINHKWGIPGFGKEGSDSSKEKVAIGPGLNKVLSPVLKGSVGGAALGGVGGATAGGVLDPEIETQDMSVLKGALLGAGGGALAGAGGGAAIGRKGISSYVKHAPARRLAQEAEDEFVKYHKLKDEAKSIIYGGGDMTKAKALRDEALPIYESAKKKKQEAMDISDKIKSSSDDTALEELFKVKESVSTRHLGDAVLGGILGAAPGAAVGGGVGALSDKENRYRGLIQGSLIGAGTGAAVGGSANLLKGLKHRGTYKELDRLYDIADSNFKKTDDIENAIAMGRSSDDAYKKLDDARTLANDAVDSVVRVSDKLPDPTIADYMMPGALGAVPAGVAAHKLTKSESPEQNKLASLFGIDKQSELDIAKKAEIIKKIRSNFSNALPQMESEEPEVPKELLDSLAKDLPDALASAGSMGIIAKPKEFQRMILIARGQPDLADGLEEHGLCFKPGAKPSSDNMVGKIIPKILEMLSPLMGDRSALAPAVHRRIIKITIAKPMDRPEELPEELSDSPVLNKISADYSAYRQQLLYKSASLVNQLIHEHPVIVTDLLGDLHIDSLSGGLVKAGGNVVESVIGMFPIDYMNKAYLGNPVSEYVDTNCDLSSLVTIGDLASCGKVA